MNNKLTMEIVTENELPVISFFDRSRKYSSFSRRVTIKDLEKFNKIIEDYIKTMESLGATN